MASQAAFEKSNIALLSSKLNHDLKLDAAHHETAWNGIEKWGAGIKVWRIEQFKVHAWPENQYGHFYSGDAFIILHSFKPAGSKSENLSHNLYFWLGKDSTQDEQGTAAYKTVELDDALGGRATQYREVQGYESDSFRHVFSALVYMDGGSGSGFHHVGAAEYKPRLLEVKGHKHPRCHDVELSAASLDGAGVFILDNGLLIYQWNGSKSHADERNEAAKVVRGLKESRDSKPKTQILDGLEECPEFWKFFGGKPKVEPAAIADDETKANVGESKLFRLSDRNPKSELKLDQIATGKAIKKDLLKSEDVFILDKGIQVFVWVGKHADKEEKAKAILYATRYLGDAKLPAVTPITRVIEGSDSSDFNSAF